MCLILWYFSFGSNFFSYSTLVTLFDCRILAMDCSSCVSTRDDLFCGWCEGTSHQCTISEACITSFPFLINSLDCPTQAITSISPMSGPPHGGTIITITGTDLGVSLNDFRSPNSISINGVACSLLNRKYILSRQVLCETGITVVGRYPVVVQLLRSKGTVSAMSSPFAFKMATVVSVEPTFGPLAGGSVLTVSGTNLNIGNSATVRVNGVSGLECSDV